MAMHVATLLRCRRLKRRLPLRKQSVLRHHLLRDLHQTHGPVLLLNLPHSNSRLHPSTRKILDHRRKGAAAYKTSMPNLPERRFSFPAMIKISSRPSTTVPTRATLTGTGASLCPNSKVGLHPRDKPRLTILPSQARLCPVIGTEGLSILLLRPFRDSECLLPSISSKVACIPSASLFLLNISPRETSLAWWQKEDLLQASYE